MVPVVYGPKKLSTNIIFLLAIGCFTLEILGSEILKSFESNPGAVADEALTFDQSTEIPHRKLATTAVTGYWSTNGSKIVDEDGVQVRFSGVNWDGMETENCVVDGLYMNRNISDMIDQMKTSGFNIIRLPFAGTCILTGLRPPSGAINFAANSDLQDLTVLSILSRLVAYAGAKDLRVILDFHRRDKIINNNYVPEDGLWFSEDFPESMWISKWELLAKKFKGNPTVIGFDLFNEPHNNNTQKPAIWGEDDLGEPYNWRTAAKRAADRIHAINPELLIFVEGVFAGASWWGEDLRGVNSTRLVLKVPNKLVYSVHDYGPQVRSQPWFNPSNYPENLPAYWDKMWGYIAKDGIAPLWIGEFGSLYDSTKKQNFTKESQWLSTLATYIKENELSWTWFTWCPNSADTGGVLTKPDYVNVDKVKLAVIRTMQYVDFFPIPPGVLIPPDSSDGPSQSPAESPSANPPPPPPDAPPFNTNEGPAAAPSIVTDTPTAPPPPPPIIGPPPPPSAAVYVPQINFLGPPNQVVLAPPPPNGCAGMKPSAPLLAAAVALLCLFCFL